MTRGRMLMIVLIAAAVCMASAGVGAADDCEQVVLEPSGLQMPELHEGYVWTGVPLWGVAQDTADAGVMQKWVYGGLPSTPAFTTTQAVRTPTVETRDATSERYLDLWVSSVYSTSKFSIGDVVIVVASKDLSVRKTAAGDYITGEAPNTEGVILDGPQTAALSGTSYIWWKVRYEDGIEGWSAEGYPGGAEYLKKVNQAPSSPRNLKATSVDNEIDLSWGCSFN